jgi:hypothetical protein
MKKIIAFVTLACFVATLPGCYTKKEIPRSEIHSEWDLSILEVVTYEGEDYTFGISQGKRAQISDTTVVGVLASGDSVRIPLSRVSRIYAQRVDVGLTVLAVIGVSLIAGIVIAA